MPSRAKCFNEDRSEASCFAAIFSVFSTLASICAVFNEQWITVKPIVNGTINNDDNNNIHKKMAYICEKVGARMFWHEPVEAASHQQYLQKPLNRHTLNYLESHKIKGAANIGCADQIIVFLFYVAISLCFVIAILSLLSAALHILLPTPKFLEWLRKNLMLEVCNVFLMLVICLLIWKAKYEVEQLHKSESKNPVDVCMGNGMFYIICSGAFSCAAALFSIYQNRLVGRTRRAENQRFICTRALRSWRDHIENSRLSSLNSAIGSGNSRPTELERYLLDACHDASLSSVTTINRSDRNELVQNGDNIYEGFTTSHQELNNDR